MNFRLPHFPTVVWVIIIVIIILVAYHLFFHRSSK